jgi:hypothetical protein
MRSGGREGEGDGVQASLERRSLFATVTAGAGPGR